VLKFKRKFRRVKVKYRGVKKYGGVKLGLLAFLYPAVEDEL
jgi:hypothetical protein